MCAVHAQVLRRSHILTGSLAFAVQILIAISVEAGDDLGRGLLAQHGTAQGVDNARAIATFEAQHGFFIEPAWQLFFLHSRHFLSLTISWVTMMHLMNGIYIFGHVFFTLGVALWAYLYHRRWFGLLRNIIILVNAFALLVYENFPVAPPRLTTGLMFDHHHFAFRDTVFGIVDAGGRMATQTGYNEFSALPSVHMAWALVAGATLVVFARPLAVKLMGVVYPILMLVAVVVTGNHYLIDVIAAVLIVIAAWFVAALFDRWWNRPDRRGFGDSPLATHGPSGSAP